MTIFTHYDSISYTKKCEGVNKLNKKKSQCIKIVKIATSSSYVKNYTKKQMNKFGIKIFVFFFSGLFSSFLSNFLDFYVEKIMSSTGIENKLKKYLKIHHS